MSIKTVGKGIGKRFVALISAVSMTIGFIPALYLNTYAAGEFSGGSGTASDPYIISSEADLKMLADKVNAGEEDFASAYYKTATESYTYYTDKGEERTGVRNITIDLSGYDTWTPIGTEDHPFKGYFSGSSDENNGNGSYGKIYNYKLKMDNQEFTAPSHRVEAVGLFGYTDGATIENVITSETTVGDSNHSISLNTYNTYSGETQSYHCIGGLVGFAKDSTIRFCTNYGAVSVTAEMGSDGGKNPELYVGAMIGGETGSEIFRCINGGAVNVWYNEEGFDGNNVTDGKRLPDVYAGGIVGGVNGISSKESKIHGSENLAKVTVNVPHEKNADNIKIFGGGIVGGASDIEKDTLEICQDYNKNAGAVINVTNSQGGNMEGVNAVAGAAGIFGYDDPDKYVHVHD